MIIDANELIKYQNQCEDLVILESKHLDRADALDQYRFGHIKASLFLDINQVVESSQDDQRKIYEDLGISDESTVVLYDDGELIGPARAYISLRNLGVKNSYILAGGMFMYQAHGGQIDQDIGQVTEIGTINAQPVDYIRYVDKEFFKSKIAKDDWLIVDARSQDQYLANGIDSAVNIFYGNLKTPQNGLKDKDQIEEILEDYLDYDNIIVYCNSAMSASITALGFKLVGKNPLIYRGY